MRHKHHKIATSRGGSNEEWNFEDLSDYDHTFTHALDFVLFESAPRFDFRLPAWTLLPIDLQEAVLAETSRRMSERVVSEETKRKQSESLKGVRKSVEHRKNLAKAQTGKKLPKETREKMSKSRSGRKQSLEHTEKIRESLLRHKVSEKCRQVAKETSKRNFSRTNKDKYRCLVTGKVSTSGPLTGYQKARGIDPKLREKIV